MSNSDTAQFDLSQFGSWYLLAGIECYLESTDMVCQCETLLLELDRVEAWEQANGGFYDPERFTYLRDSISEKMADIEAWDAQWYAEKARDSFTVIEGGKKVI